MPIPRTFLLLTASICSAACAMEQAPPTETLGGASGKADDAAPFDWDAATVPYDPTADDASVTSVGLEASIHFPIDFLRSRSLWHTEGSLSRTFQDGVPDPPQGGHDWRGVQCWLRAAEDVTIAQAGPYPIERVGHDRFAFHYNEDNLFGGIRTTRYSEVTTTIEFAENADGLLNITCAKRVDGFATWFAITWADVRDALSNTRTGVYVALEPTPTPAPAPPDEEPAF